MPHNLPRLCELQIVISEPAGNSYPVAYTLLIHDSYPPEPRRETNRIVFRSQPTLLGKIERMIPADLFNAAVLAPAPGRKRVDDIFARLVALRSEWPLDRIMERMDNLALHLFHTPAHDMLKELWSHAAPVDRNLYGAPPSSLARLTLSFDSPALNRVPWELMPPRWAELGWLGPGDSMILRRSRALAGEKSGSFDLPVNVAIDAHTAPVLPGQVDDWGKDLFDDFTSEARQLGGIEWGELGKLKSGEIHHVLFDSADPESLELTWSKVQGIGQGARERGGWAVPPRLLVLHDVSSQIPSYLMTSLIHSALASGADAVLLAGLNTIKPDAGNFFPTFYRKLMHNLPLDQCLLMAKAAAREQNWPVECSFGARDGGEFSVLLSRALLEAAQPKVAPRRTRRGGIPRTFNDLPSYGTGAVPKQSMGKRAFRVASEIKNHTRRMVADASETVYKDAKGRLRGITFDEELHGVDELVKAREDVAEAKREIGLTEKVLKSVVTSKPEVVQKAALRLTNLWLTENNSGGQRRIMTRKDFLVSQRPYNLHLQIGTRRLEALAAEVFPDEKLTQIFEKYETITLDVMFFSPDTDFKLEGDMLGPPQDAEKRVVGWYEAGERVPHENIHARWGAQATLSLPRYGSSNEIKIKITPREEGQRRIRVCIYYRNVLLQSVLLEATVVQEVAAQATADAVSKESVLTARMIDYVASVDLALLNELPQPSLNIFTNHAPDGTHWMGIFSSGDTNDFQLRSGEMHTFGAGQLSKMAEMTREVLINIEGDKKVYKFSAPLPLNENDIRKREGYLRDLAVSGYELYDALFLSRTDTKDLRRLKNVRGILQDSHIVSIARCREDSATIPWAALYTEPLATTKKDEISLCSVFKAQLAANKWSPDMSTLVEKHDLLDDPRACRNLPDCPLMGEKRKLTVCPFGFWGFLHQIEQPLQQVKPTPVDELPEEMKNPDFSQTSFLFCPDKEHVKVTVGTYPDIPEVNDHGDEIRAMNKSLPLDVVYEDDRDEVMKLLTAGGQHVFYFYCHGELNHENIFMLKLGPSAKPGYIAAAELDPFEIEWPEQPKPLFILNGCETMALLPDVIHGFLGKLKLLGASGIIGTEIRVWTQLARPFGRQLLENLLGGLSVGEACLKARRNLMRQYNPLGLVYSYYSPATLHLHNPSGCGWCGSHQHLGAKDGRA